MAAFIVFEGGEGAGKSTQSRLLSRRLTREGYRVTLTHEPGGTPVGQVIRRWLKTHPGLTPLTELLLFTGARAQLMEKMIAPALDGQKIVVCDRFTASTVAYQGYGRGLDLKLIDQLNMAATHGLRPDLTVFLDVPVEAGLARKSASMRDTFESEPVEFHKRVREGYLKLAQEDPERWVIVDASLSTEETSELVWENVALLLADSSSRSQ